ncbi:sulfite exporter TauE/SafE family protein [Anaerotignum sp.]|uniref:sulfite exporter TauE/SafE family protein n=1 Tax=Anaerotignum sp. TaxID=2039241 RepID=UPI0028A0A7CB|nr:sulfite exporter TauE/SafE family protein [Anaerotignum sp.]
MESSIKERRLHIGGMTCVSCQNKMEKTLRSTEGIKSAQVSYVNGFADICYDESTIALEYITTLIQGLDYTVLPNREVQSFHKKQVVGVLVIIPSLYLLMQQFGILNLFTPSQLADVSMGHGMLFVIGLMTSVHCVAMCGGVNLSQCVPANQTSNGKGGFISTLRPSLLYNLGRVLSYTTVGFVVGGLGSLITFSNTMQGVIKLIAGIFMMIMGLNMLGIFPWLRRFQPRFPFLFAHSVENQKIARGPLFVGLLNGLMPCGPLQAMQIYALSTGSPFSGAFSMFMFSLGTVPLMFGLGALSSFLGKRFTNKILTAGAVLVVVLGMSMFSQGWSLSGWKLPQIFPGNLAAKVDTPESNVKVENGVQIINSTLASGRYPSITVEKGMPVKWVIDAPEGSINGCNNRIFIPEYNVEYQFKAGENIIEFMPSKTGEFPYSCWMGMIRSSIRVVEGKSTIPIGDESLEQSVVPNGPVPTNYTIPTEEMGLGEKGDTIQKVTIELTDDGFRPGVIVLQKDMETEWTIHNSSSKESSSKLLIPYFAVQIPLDTAENLLNMYPTDDFSFSNGDSSFFGYVKVVEDSSNINIDAIKKEVSNFQPMIWPSETFASRGGAPSCH